GKKAILMLHGRGGSAEDILTLAHNYDATCYAFTADNNVWYPMSFLVKKELNEPYLSHSLNLIDSVIKELRKNHEQVFLLGFSQGACLSLEYASKNFVDGVIAFSGGLIGENSELSVEIKTKVFI